MKKLFVFILLLWLWYLWYTYFNDIKQTLHITSQEESILFLDESQQHLTWELMKKLDWLWSIKTVFVGDKDSQHYITKFWIEKWTQLPVLVVPKSTLQHVIKEYQKEIDNFSWTDAEKYINKKNVELYNSFIKPWEKYWYFSFWDFRYWEKNTCWKDDYKYYDECSQIVANWNNLDIAKEYFWDQQVYYEQNDELQDIQIMTKKLYVLQWLQYTSVEEWMYSIDLVSLLEKFEYKFDKKNQKNIQLVINEENLMLDIELMKFLDVLVKSWNEELTSDIKIITENPSQETLTKKCYFNQSPKLLQDYLLWKKIDDTLTQTMNNCIDSEITRKEIQKDYDEFSKYNTSYPYYIVNWKYYDTSLDISSLF